MPETYSVEAVLSAVDKSFGSTLRQATKEINSLWSGSKSFDDVGGKASNMFKSMLGANLVSSAISKLSSVASAGFRSMATEMNDSAKAWKTFEGNEQYLGRSTEEIKKAKAEMQDFATKTIYSASEMASTYSQLDATGTKNVGQLVKGMGGLAAATDNPKQAMKTLSQQMTQMSAKPYVAWQDYKLMMEQTPAGMAAVAKEMGMSMAEMQTSIQAGTLSTEDFQNAVIRAGNSQGFQDMATKFKTIDQAIDGTKEGLANKLQPAFEAVNQFGIRAFQGLANVLDKIKFDKFGADLQNALSKIDIEGIISRLASSISKGVSAIKQFYDGFRDSGALTSAQTALDSVWGAIKNVISAFSGGDISSLGAKVGTAFKAVADVVTLVANAIKGLSPTQIQLITGAIVGLMAGFKAFSIVTSIVSTISKVVETFNLIRTAIGGLSGAWELLVGVFASNPFGWIAAVIVGIIAFLVVLWNTNEGFRNAVVAIWESIKQAFATAWTAIQAAWSQAQPFFEALWNAIVSTASAIWDGVVAIWTTTVDTIKAVWGPISEFFVNLWNGVVTVATNVWTSFVTGITPVIESIKNLWNSLSEFFGVLWSAIVSYAVSTWNNLVSFFTPIIEAIKAAWNMLEPAISAIWSLIQTDISTALSIIATIFSTSWAVVTTVVQASWTIITTIISTAINIIAGIIQLVTALMKGDWQGVWDAICNIASTVWNAIVTIVTTYINAAMSIISSILSAIGSIWNSIWNEIKSVAGAIWDGIVSIVTSLINSLLSAISNIMNSISSTMSNIWNGISSTVSNIVQGLVNGAVNIFNSLVSSVSNIVSSVGNVLSGIANIDLGAAGRAIINGFLGGLESAFESVKSFVGGIASWIADHKGPISYDKRLLIPAGNAIMGGFNTALQNGFKDVQGNVKGMAGSLQSTFSNNVSGAVSSSYEIVHTTKPANINLSLGSRDYTVFVDDIDNKLNSQARLRESY